MKKIREEINELKKLTSKMPKTITEAMEFSEKEINDDDFGFNEDEFNDIPEDNTNIEEPITSEPPLENNNGMNIVDDIRKLALKTMANLADNPDDPAYIILKKVWQMCDKKPEEQNKVSE